MKIIVGLGNPGEQYKNTRHNIGWLALDNFLGEVSWLENKKFNSLVFERDGVLFIKPLTFMNDSGRAVQKILNYYKLIPKNFALLSKKDADLTNVLVVIHDDLDLNFTDLKIATDSGSAGHRGVQSIINYLKTKKFTRVRLGIKNELVKIYIPPEKFVIQPFSQEERLRLKEIFSKIDINKLK